MNRIEAEVHAHFAEASSREESTAPTDTTAVPTSSSSLEDTSDTPFANVNSVIPGSPADTAGMRAGDHVIRFGIVNWLNHDKLAKVAEVVSQNEGVISTMLTMICLVLTITASDSSNGQTKYGFWNFGDEASYSHTTAELGWTRLARMSSPADVVCDGRITDVVCTLRLIIMHDCMISPAFT